MLDKSHATHVGRQVVQVRGVPSNRLAVLLEIQIERQIFDILESLIPFVDGLTINSPNSLNATAAQGSNQISPNEPTRSSDDHYPTRCAHRTPPQCFGRLAGPSGDSSSVPFVG